MQDDPLDMVFETPEESLAHYLRAMPKSLIPVFEREFMRRPTTGAGDLASPSDEGRCIHGLLICSYCDLDWTPSA